MTDIAPVYGLKLDAPVWVRTADGVTTGTLNGLTRDTYGVLQAVILDTTDGRVVIPWVQVRAIGDGPNEW